MSSSPVKDNFLNMHARTPFLEISHYGQVVILYSVRWLSSCATVGKFTRDMIRLIDERIQLTEIFAEDDQVEMEFLHLQYYTLYIMFGRLVKATLLKKLKRFPPFNFTNLESKNNIW